MTAPYRGRYPQSITFGTSSSFDSHAYLQAERKELHEEMIKNGERYLERDKKWKAKAEAEKEKEIILLLI